MKLRDFAEVAVYNKYWVSVYEPGHRHYPINEFESTNKEELKRCGNYIVTGIWVLDADTMCVSVLTEVN